ncbi:hypothetical protein E8E14_005242 [Neopestalotiopsis sp. 37M]|nr:hypothetical protein E8E14_005242 [Neopestalotiopsis sp. 37M]
MSGSNVVVTMGDVILLLETVYALLMTEFLRRMDGAYTDSSREAALRFTLALADKLRFVQANLDLDDVTRKEGLPLDEVFADLAVTFKDKALQLEAAVVDLTEHLLFCVSRRESETRKLRILQDLEREREFPLMGHTAHPTDLPVAQLLTQLPTDGAVDSNPRHDTIDSSRYFVVGLVGDAVSYVGMVLVLGLLFLVAGFLWYAIWAAMTNGLPRMRGH